MFCLETIFTFGYLFNEVIAFPSSRCVKKIHKNKMEKITGERPDFSPEI